MNERLDPGRRRCARLAFAGALLLSLCASMSTPAYARQAPANDNLDAAATLGVSNSGETTGDLTGATQQEGEPIAPHGSVWFKFTAPATGRWVFDVSGSTTSPELVIFIDTTPATAPSFDDLEDVGYVSPQSTFRSADHVVLAATSGTTYYVAVHGPEDTFTFSWRRAVLSRVLWQHTSGAITLWTVDDAGTIVSHPTYGPFAGWQAIKLVVDKDGYSRVLWRHASGITTLWKVDAAGAIVASPVYGPYDGWTATDVATTALGQVHLAWTSASGVIAVWEMPADADTVVSSATYGPYAGWQPLAIAVDGDLIRRILWQSATGAVGLWKEFWPYAGVADFGLTGPFASWNAIDIAATDVDESTRVLWRHQTGAAGLWRQLHDGTLNIVSYGPFSGWQPEATALSQATPDYEDVYTRILWRHSGGAISIWKTDAAGALVKSFVYGPFAGWSVVDIAAGPE